MTQPDAVVDSPGWVRLAWDSDHFGFAIGRLLSPTFSEVDLTKALHSADTEGIRCLYWLSDPDAAQTALGERAGFKKVDVRVQLGADLRSEPRRVDAVPGIREAVESDLPRAAIATLASTQTGHLSEPPQTRFTRPGSNAASAMRRRRFMYQVHPVNRAGTSPLESPRKATG
jgi:hypothetical protein